MPSAGTHLTPTRPPGTGRHAAPATSAGTVSPSFRPDIEGLRAVAVLLVVAFHAGLPLLPGGYLGVDVFFVISGFLITGLLVDELARKGRLSIPAFYARRARRLLPMSALVVVVTLVVSWFVVAPVDLGNVAGAGLASSLFVANLFFARQSGDYLAGDLNTNPFLHFWSLSVEEQFYLFWPLLLILAVGALARRGGSPAVLLRRAGLAVAVVGALSLAWSVHWTATDGAQAYFALTTRAWELAAGGLLAVSRPLLPRIPRGVAVLMGWLGLAAVLWSSVSFTTSTPMPGASATIPVAGTVLLLAAGARVRYGATALLSTGPMRRIGRLSYSWYLWHWPALVLVGIATAAGPSAQDDTGGHVAPLWALLAVLVSYLLAEASTRWVEAPFRDSVRLRGSVRASLRLGAALVAAGAVASVVVLVLANGASTTAASARQDVPRPVAPGCNVSYADTHAAGPADCLVGSGNGSPSVVLLGDSHADQWNPALSALAADRGWQVRSWTKSVCPVAAVEVWMPKYSRAYTECDTWRAEVAERLRELGPVDVVVIGRTWDYQGLTLGQDGERVSRSEAARLWGAASAAAFRELLTTAKHVVVLTDTPAPGGDIPSCVSTSSAADCAFAREGHVRHDALLSQAERAAAPEGVSFVDLTDLICPPAATCPVADAQGRLIYRDASHITAAYAEQLAGSLGDRIQRIADGTG